MSGTLESRLDVRLSRELKELISAAAALTGQTVSDFAVSTLAEMARRVIQQNSMTVLSDRDRDIFMRMLDADGKPNEALRRAAKRYKKHHARMED